MQNIRFQKTGTKRDVQKFQYFYTKYMLEQYFRYIRLNILKLVAFYFLIRLLEVLNAITWLTFYLAHTVL